MDHPTTRRAHTSRRPGYFCGAKLRAVIPTALQEKTSKSVRSTKGTTTWFWRYFSPNPVASSITSHGAFPTKMCHLQRPFQQSVFKQRFFHSCLTITNIFKIEFHNGCCTDRWEMPPEHIRGEWLELTLATKLQQSIIYFSYWWWLEHRRKCGLNKINLDHLHLNLPTILPCQNPSQPSNLQNIIKQSYENSTAWNNLSNYKQKT